MDALISNAILGFALDCQRLLATLNASAPAVAATYTKCGRNPTLAVPVSDRSENGRPEQPLAAETGSGRSEP